MKKRRFGAEGEDEAVIMGKERSGVKHCCSE